MQDFPDVLEAPTQQRPVTPTPAARSLIDEGTVLRGDVETVSLVKEEEGLSRLKGLLTKGRSFPNLTRAAGPVGLASVLYIEICRWDSIKCLVFDSEPELAPVPTAWKLSPYVADFTRENGQDGVRMWDPVDGRMEGGPYGGYFSAVSPDGYGGGSASWAGDPECHPDCYPHELQGLGPLQFAVTFWGGGWDRKLWWLPVHGPASVPGFDSVTRVGYPEPYWAAGQDPLRLIYRPVISTTSVTVNSQDDPAIPNAQPGVTIPDGPDWPDRTADLLTQPENLEALELLQRRIDETQVAESLQSLNAEAELTDDEAGKIARTCLATVAAAGLNRDKCREPGLPIFVSGNDWRGVSTVEATRHDIEVLTPVPGDAPRSPLLNYERRSQKIAAQGSPQWYVSDPVCTAEDRPSGTDCDEFPFYSTQQGGKYAPTRPDLKVIPADDNQAQGRALYVDLYRKCGMRSGVSGATTNAVGGDAFLVVPVPEPVGLPTVGLCNGKTPATP